MLCMLVNRKSVAYRENRKRHVDVQENSWEIEPQVSVDKQSGARAHGIEKVLKK